MFKYLLFIMLLGVWTQTWAMTESRFNFIITKFEYIYGPIVASHGGRLEFYKNWKSDDTKASSKRDEHSNRWLIIITGGVARHHSVTEDGLNLILCHEMGHHLGGLPLKKNENGKPRWASSEGAADYFATVKCLRKIFEKEDNVKIVKKLWPHPYIVKSCHEAFHDTNDVAICMRSALAAKSVTAYLGERAGNRQSYLQSPEHVETVVTNLTYSSVQCRLDTFFQGAICDADANEELSYEDISKASCARPLCWYRPLSQ